MTRRVLTLAMIAALFAPACTGGSNDDAYLNLPPPPPPPPPAPGAGPLPEAPGGAAAAATVDAAFIPGQDQVLAVPPGSAMLENFNSGIHRFVLHKPYPNDPSKKSDILPTPPIVKVGEVVAMKTAFRVEKAGDSFSLFQINPPLKEWDKYKKLVAVVRGGDENEVSMSFSVGQGGEFFYSRAWYAEPNQKMWNKVEIPLEAFKSADGRSPTYTKPIESMAAAFFRNEEQKPQPPFDKVVYIARLYLTI